jgi:hypothetical protein
METEMADRKDRQRVGYRDKRLSRDRVAVQHRDYKGRIQDPLYCLNL